MMLIVRVTARERLPPFVLPGFVCQDKLVCVLELGAFPHLFACFVIARTLQAAMVGTVTDDRLWQAL